MRAHVGARMIWDDEVRSTVGFINLYFCVGLFCSSRYGEGGVPVDIARTPGVGGQWLHFLLVLSFWMAMSARPYSFLDGHLGPSSQWTSLVMFIIVFHS